MVLGTIIALKSMDNVGFQMKINVEWYHWNEHSNMCEYFWKSFRPAYISSQWD